MCSVVFRYDIAIGLSNIPKPFLFFHCRINIGVVVYIAVGIALWSCFLCTCLLLVRWRGAVTLRTAHFFLSLARSLARSFSYTLPSSAFFSLNLLLRREMASVFSLRAHTYTLKRQSPLRCCRYSPLLAYCSAASGWSAQLSEEKTPPTKNYMARVYIK